MQEISDTSTLPLHLTTEDHNVFGNILWKLLLKPVTATAHNDEALVLPLLAFQQGKHTELILRAEIKQGFQATAGSSLVQVITP